MAVGVLHIQKLLVSSFLDNKLEASVRCVASCFLSTEHQAFSALPISPCPQPTVRHLTILLSTEACMQSIAKNFCSCSMHSIFALDTMSSVSRYHSSIGA